MSTTSFRYQIEEDNDHEKNIFVMPNFPFLTLENQCIIIFFPVFLDNPHIVNIFFKIYMYMVSIA